MAKLIDTIKASKVYEKIAIKKIENGYVIVADGKEYAFTGANALANLRAAIEDQLTEDA